MQNYRLNYGGWFVPCRISVFSGRQSQFSGFSHGDLSPRQAKIRQTEAENATHGMSRTFVWRGERSPCENTKKSPFCGFLRGDLLCVRGENAKGRHAKSRQIVIFHHFAGFRVAPFRVFAWRGERSPRENPLNGKKNMVMVNGDFGGFSRGDLSTRQAKIRQTRGEKATHEFW